MVGYEDLKAEVAENWLSATREDAIRLSNMRPSKGDLPLLSQLQIMNDLKAGHSATYLAAEYGTNTRKVGKLSKGIILLRQPLPPGFTLLTSSFQLDCL